MAGNGHICVWASRYHADCRLYVASSPKTHFVLLFTVRTFRLLLDALDRNEQVHPVLRQPLLHFFDFRDLPSGRPQKDIAFQAPTPIRAHSAGSRSRGATAPICHLFTKRDVKPSGQTAWSFLQFADGTSKEEVDIEVGFILTVGDSRFPATHPPPPRTFSRLFDCKTRA